MASFLKKTIKKKNTEYIEKISSQPVESAKLALEDLTTKEEEYIQSNIALAMELLKELGIVNQTHLFHPSSIGKAIESWFDQNLANQFRITQDVYSSAMACAWGHFLVEKLDMEWHVITDNYGTEIGLYHKKNNATIFPFSSTDKAFTSKAFDLLSIITDKTIEVLAME